MSVTLDGSKGLLFSGGDYQNTPGFTGFRNRIINGDMRIDQRNNGAAVTPSTINAAAYVTDRFYHITNIASKLTYQQVVDAPAGFRTSTKISVAAQYSPAAADIFLFRQSVEGQNIIDFQLGLSGAASFTISQYIKGSVSGVYSVVLQNGAGNRSYIGTINVTTSWARVVITVLGDTTGTWATDLTTGFVWGIDLGSGSNYNTTAGTWQAGNFFRTVGSTTFVNQVAGSTLNITGVQLELGTVATPFEQRPIGTEKALCRDYFRRVFMASGTIATANTVQFYIPHEGMRISPTPLAPSVIAITDSTGNGTQSSANITTASNTKDGGIYNATNFTGLTALRPCGLFGSTFIDLSAEL